MQLTKLLILLIIFIFTPLSFAQTTFKVGIPVYARTIDPHNTLNMMIIYQIYEPLVRFIHQDPVPVLATKWHRTDPNTMRLTLRKNVTFHDGSKLTANDVVYSIKRFKKGILKAAANTISDVKIVDENTIDIHLTTPDPLILKKLQLIMIISESWAKKHKVKDTIIRAGEKSETQYIDNHSNGTGPFQTTVRDPGIKTELTRHKNYWDDTIRTNIDKVIIFPIVNNATRVSALVSGELDFINYIAPQDLSLIEGVKGFKVLTVQNIGTIFVGVNLHADELNSSTVTGKNPFKDKNVRLAIQIAIPVKLFIEKVLRGSGIPAGTLVTPESNGFSKSLNETPPYDVAAAKNLLSQAGYPNGFDVTMPCLQFVEPLCNIYAVLLSKINTKLTIDTVPLNNFQDAVEKGDADIWFWVTNNTTFDGATPLENVYQTNGVYNYGKYSDPELDKLIMEIGSELDVNKRNALLKIALFTAKESLAVIPFYFLQSRRGAKDNIDIPKMIFNVPLFKYYKINK